MLSRRGKNYDQLLAWGYKSVTKNCSARKTYKFHYIWKIPEMASSRTKPLYSALRAYRNHSTCESIKVNSAIVKNRFSTLGESEIDCCVARQPSPTQCSLCRAGFIAWCLRWPNSRVPAGSNIFCDGHAWVAVRALLPTLKWPWVKNPTGWEVEWIDNVVLTQLWSK